MLSSQKYCPVVESVLQNAGFVGLLYVALSSPEIAKQRVAERVRRGGHGVPEDRIAAAGSDHSTFYPGLRFERLIFGSWTTPYRIPRFPFVYWPRDRGAALDSRLRRSFQNCDTQSMKCHGSPAYCKNAAGVSTSDIRLIQAGLRSSS